MWQKLLFVNIENVDRCNMNMKARTMKSVVAIVAAVGTIAGVAAIGSLTELRIAVVENTAAIPLLLANSFFILSMRAIAKSILGPVTIHICEPANVLSFKQSQAMNLSINSDTPNPIAFFIQRCLLSFSVTNLSNIVPS
jgi:hypothetical protein